MIILPKNFEIGHADDGFTGVTVVLAKKGAVGGVDCRGGGPGTRETDLLKPEKMMQEIDAVVLTGGSAFGLASCTGVMDFLKQNGVGYKVGSKRVPIVPAAVLFDLNHKEYHYPTAELGFKACENASRTPSLGKVGAGKGATVGKIRGLKNCSAGGIGAATVKVMGINVTAVMAVNALGDIVDPATNQIIAGARAKDGSFIGTEKCILDGSYLKLLLGANTTIGCILTDAKLDKVQANKLASIAHNGLARTIRPVHTDYDGDTIFCLASGAKPVLNFMLLEVAAVEATAQAVLNAVRDGGNVILDDDE